MDIADIDKSGTINEEEFKKFLSKFDASITPDKCLVIFQNSDDGKKGELTTEQFGMAIHEAMETKSSKI